jgi:putative component of membrane protein insertase Oxa1/YidC/SpoIIIJ protein YidD
MRALALALIRIYQRLLSPRKGFACAYRCLTGRHSCSHFAARAIKRSGILSGLRLIRRRFQACSLAHGQLSIRRHAQSGFCECDSLDVSDCVPDDCDFSGCSPRKALGRLRSLATQRSVDVSISPKPPIK